MVAFWEFLVLVFLDRSALLSTSFFVSFVLLLYNSPVLEIIDCGGELFLKKTKVSLGKTVVKGTRGRRVRIVVVLVLVQITKSIL